LSGATLKFGHLYWAKAPICGANLRIRRAPAAVYGRFSFNADFAGSLVAEHRRRLGTVIGTPLRRTLRPSRIGSSDAVGAEDAGFQ
jgi:hypothetical protein